MPDYGADHQRERRRLEPAVMAGEVDCARCGEKIDPWADALELGCEPWQTWDLGHHDVDPSLWTGPEHARRTSKHPACNRATRPRRFAQARRPAGKHPGLR